MSCQSAKWRLSTG